MKVRLTPDEDARTLILTYENKDQCATQCLTVKELVDLMSVGMHIEGRGNGLVILMGCV